ncbi:hypothetical protein E6Q11_06480 [Candidatus Dojkabacteria bacterium]|uniref:Uncharacterized protein n=1 Tax=Candidatus Dojkabacteria bacterium TaxID=2099670 RepID=A0A5C7J2U0_9BACT|nr:MAG: hypothetical protein E6Q11_06480 [Candidatus Dojkabacteria bacterium]
MTAAFDDFFSDEFNFEVFNSPQPIKIAKDETHILLIKQDVVIIKVAQEDNDTIRNLKILLDGLVRGGIVFGEIEQMRDIIAYEITKKNFEMD